MAISNTNTPRTITKVNDGNDSFNATNVETNELVEGTLISTEVINSDLDVEGNTTQTTTINTYSDDVATRRVNGEVRAIITRG
jgi:hypothetical protein